jgi:hypothetical protein
VDDSALVVSRRPLQLIDGKLVLGEPRSERVMRQLDGRGFADAALVGDTVSLHWGWVCEVLTTREARLLERWTQHHLAIANRTI